MNKGDWGNNTPMGAMAISDVARIGHALPPGWIERTLDRVRDRVPHT